MTSFFSNAPTGGVARQLDKSLAARYLPSGWTVAMFLLLCFCTLLALLYLRKSFENDVNAFKSKHWIALLFLSTYSSFCHLTPPDI
jgi:succinate dehydrogenase hydrophobic anchor subunit